MRQLFLIGLRSLAQHQKRSLMLGGAIAGVTMLLVMLVSLSHGVNETLLRSATTLMTGHVNVAGFYKVTAGQSAPVVTQHQKAAEIVRREVPELSYMSQRGRGWAALVSDSGSKLQVGIFGIDITQEPGFREVVRVSSGSLEGLKEPGTILIFEEQAKKLGVKVGDVLTFSAPTPRGVNNTLDVRIVAVGENMGMFSQFNAFIPEPSLRALYQLNDQSTGALQLYLKNLKDIPEVQARLRKAFEKAGYGVMENDPTAFWMKFEKVNREDWTGQKIDVTTWEDEISFIKGMVTALDVLGYLLIVVLVIIVGIGIMNTLWISIRERTREIGTLRAIGMQRRSVLVMFVIESFTLGLIAGVAGAVLGAGVCLGVNALKIQVPEAVQLFLMSNRLELAVTPGVMFGVVVGISICTALVSLIPSFLAARLKPITAMHHIG